MAMFALFEASLAARVRHSQFRVEATAFSKTGPTRAGTTPHVGIIAADHHILPLGTRVQVTQAGRYSGIYTVRDTGSDVKGRRIDLYIPDPAAARRFGRKTVSLRVLRWGNGHPVGSAANGAASASR